MFIDNLIIISPKNIDVIARVKIELFTPFNMIDIDLINFYLVLKVEKLCQKKIIKLFELVYIQKIFIKYYLDKVNCTNILMKKIALGPNLPTKMTQAKKEKY